METYFIASLQKARILDEVIKHYIDLIVKQKGSKVYTDLSYKQNYIGKAYEAKSIYEAGDRLAVHYVQQKKQQ